MVFFVAVLNIRKHYSFHDLIFLEQESILNENSMSKKCTSVVSYKCWS